MPAPTTSATPIPSRERADLLQALTAHRSFLRHTVAGLTDDQARLRPTASELTLGGLIKHVGSTERAWADFITGGPGAMTGADDPEQQARWAEEFTMGAGETLADVLTSYEQVARRTDDLVRTLPDLDTDQPLPPAPWFEAGARRSARRVLLHVIAETAQHAGHADVLRESIDGQKTMG